MIVECLRDIGGHDLPIKKIILHTRQEESYNRIRRRGNMAGCDDRSKYSRWVHTGT